VPGSVASTEPKEKRGQRQRAKTRETEIYDGKRKAAEFLIIKGSAKKTCRHAFLLSAKI